MSQNSTVCNCPWNKLQLKTETVEAYLDPSSPTCQCPEVFTESLASVNFANIVSVYLWPLKNLVSL